MIDLMKILIIILILFFSYGCGEAMYRSQAQVNTDNTRLDAVKCKGYGFSIGTNQYANCMMLQDNNRQKINAQNSKELRAWNKCLLKNSGWSDTPKTFGQILGEC